MDIRSFFVGCAECALRIGREEVSEEISGSIRSREGGEKEGSAEDGGVQTGGQEGASCKDAGASASGSETNGSKEDKETDRDSVVG